VKVIPGIRHFKEPLKKSVLTIGNFDGVHLGHQELIHQVVSRAKGLHVPAVVMTFEPHPIKVLYPDRDLKRLFDFEDQRIGLEKLGIDLLVVEPFSREFSQLPAERYLREWVFEPFSPDTVVVGYDFSFGANREGSLQILKNQGKLLGFQVLVVPAVQIGGISISSSRIRQALQEGDIRLATEFLGRHFYISGLVEKGVGRGRKIGIPTANIHLQTETYPRQGVYCGWSFLKERRFPCVVNIGRNPTFNDAQNPLGSPVSIECHILDFTGDIYGEELRVEFVDRLRDEKKFSSADELVKQIHQDIVEGRTRLKAEVDREYKSK
jgi:riboflavin kinase/FMN adenylyltransferase